MERHWPAATDQTDGTLTARARTVVGWLDGGWLPLAIGLAGAAIGALAYTSWATCNCDKISAPTEVSRIVAGLSFVAAGVLALGERRFRRTGVLLAAVGATWFFYELGFVYLPLPYTLARVGEGLWQPVLAHLALAFPGGRLRSRFEVVVVVCAYGLYALTSLADLAFWHVSDPRLNAMNLLFVQNNPRAEGAVELFSQLLVLVLAGIVLGIVVWHWRIASVPGRRALTPLLWASGPLVVVVGGYAVLGTRYFPSLLPLAMTALPIAFAVGLLQIRLSRAGIGGLVVQLGQHPPPDRLQEALAHTLHDPTLQVAYWARDSERWVDVSGQTIEIPAPGAARVATRIERDGELIALLVHDRALRDDAELIDASMAAARLALENERLQAEVSAQLQEVRASRARIVNVRDAERQRLERDLHDGAQQRLVTLSLALKLLQARMRSDTDPQVAATLRGAIDELAVALSELRELARGIHPAILTEAGLGPATRSLAERMPIPVSVSAPDERLPAPIEVGAYYVVAEALTNIAKHARATTAGVSVELTSNQVRIVVADDGAGGADPSRGSGLQGVFDRVRALDGRAEVVSPPGAGTKVVAEIPFARMSAEEP